MTLADRLEGKSLFVQRVLAFALLPVTIACAWLLLASPVTWVLTSQPSWREAVRAELARSRGEAAALKTLAGRTTALPSAAIWQRLYANDAPGSAGNTAQQDVTLLITAAGLQTQSIALMPREQDGALVRHAVRVSMTGPADRFQAFLAKVRTNTRYLRVERLTVTSPATQRADENPPLTIIADIVGFEAERPKAGASPAT